MRKHTARHWLHAALDLLPVILIPVFMIYSHRHTIDSGSIEVPVNKVVDFNQLCNPYNFENLSTGRTLCIFEYEANHKILINQNYSRVASSGDIDYQVWFNGEVNQYYDINQLNSFIWERPSTQQIQIEFTNYTSNTLDSMTICVYDLTQMFGIGNEPTIQQFNTWYPNLYYDYTLSRKELLKDYSTQTYDDTDIMSQMTYQLYNSVDKYFNMGNVFGMINVYDWFNLNIFSGQAPISIYIVWNIVLYEFVMDLLFLLYALFMWFIDVTKRLIEKPLDSIQ